MFNRIFPKLTLKKVLKEVLTTLLFIFVIANVMSYFRAPQLSSDKLPRIQQELLDSSVFNTTELEGKPLLIHFWATWCPVCKVEASNIQTISEKFHVVTIAVKSGDDATIRAYLQEQGLSFKTLNDSSSHHANAFKVSVFPTTFMYDKEHNLQFTEVGYTSTWMLYLKMLYLSI